METVFYESVVIFAVTVKDGLIPAVRAGYIGKGVVSVFPGKGQISVGQRQTAGKAIIHVSPK